MPPELPDRVIHVPLLGGDPRLVEGSGIVSRYATLSHCWGGVSPMMTMKSNLKQRMAGIPLNELPKTFREAIQICQELLIPYLWIDSICIIQDSPEDWQIQSSKMHLIYDDSTITLAALDAIDSSEGLFLPKRPFIDVFPLAQTFGDGKGQAYIGVPSWNEYIHCPWPALDAFQYHLQQIQNEFSAASYIRSGLLQTRAWAMQELRLSARILYFFKGEVMWRCTGSIWRQNGCRQTPFVGYNLRATLDMFERNLERVHSMFHAHPDYRSPSSSRARSGSSAIRSDKHDHESTDHSGKIAGGDSDGDDSANSVVDIIQEIWYKIVADYSACDLTLAEDKLPALSGMASRFHYITEDVYLAGHWRVNLAQSLFWVCVSRTMRVQMYRAPTWSWASIDGSLSIRESPPSEAEGIPSIQILDACTQVSGENHFGQVSGGHISVCASTMAACWSSAQRTWTTSSSRIPLSSSNDMYSLTVVDCNNLPFAHWDYDDRLRGMWPGPLLTKDSAASDAEARLIYGYDKAAGDQKALWSVGSYVPEDLLLVKGFTSGFDEQGQEQMAILVLKQVHGSEKTYERVGRGTMTGWDDDTAMIETLKIV